MEHGKVLRIDADTLMKYKSEHDINKRALDLAGIIDELKTDQAVFSMKLSPEIANGLTNLMYVMFYNNTTPGDINRALVIRPNLIEFCHLKEK